MKLKCCVLFVVFGGVCLVGKEVNAKISIEYNNLGENYEYISNA